MSTNYYISTTINNIEVSSVHIAKETGVGGGRVEYTFQAILNDFNKVTVGSWQELKGLLGFLPNTALDTDVCLVDEYGETIGIDKFIEMVETSPTSTQHGHKSLDYYKSLGWQYEPQSWQDGDGYVWHPYEFS